MRFCGRAAEVLVCLRIEWRLESIDKEEGLILDTTSLRAFHHTMIMEETESPSTAGTTSTSSSLEESNTKLLKELFIFQWLNLLDFAPPSTAAVSTSSPNISKSLFKHSATMRMFFSLITRKKRIWGIVRWVDIVFGPKRGGTSTNSGAVIGKRSSLIKCTKDGVLCCKAMVEVIKRRSYPDHDNLGLRPFLPLKFLFKELLRMVNLGHAVHFAINL
ncbi:hypothetical protein CMV_012491 [Castanea mollissima]|uniref:Uncharacterized protein n=1 Tax=Castanea mollissima TaxID=60419 RepID=A0A8J4RHL4_9ROSI|nr:hypothetical protein CMV_012491 [Castanea mollissima]